MRGRRRIEMAGQRFGRLLVLSYAESRGATAHWNVRCDCGVECVRSGGSLRSGNTRSCGCFGSEASAARKLTHGYARRGAVAQEFRIWAKINERCYDPNCGGFKDYGGRGIAMCDEWRADFTAFLRDMGPRPSPEHSVDRINNDGPYSPENCRWATHAQQARNSRQAKMTVENVKRLRALRAEGVPNKDLAVMFGVSTATASAIGTGRTWADV